VVAFTTGQVSLALTKKLNTDFFTDGIRSGHQWHTEGGAEGGHTPSVAAWGRQKDAYPKAWVKDLQVSPWRQG